MTIEAIVKAFAAIIMIVFLGCIEEGGSVKDRGTVPIPPVPDLSTPDNALRSLWAYDAWSDTAYLPYYNTNVYLSHYSGQMRAVLGGVIALNYKRRRGAKEKNRIETVEIQSNSMAIVKVSKFSVFDESFKEEQYILTKDSSGWVIDDERRGCTTCDGTGKVDDYSTSYPWRKKSCLQCGGTGILSHIQELRKELADTLKMP